MAANSYRITLVFSDAIEDEETGRGETAFGALQEFLEDNGFDLIEASFVSEDIFIRKTWTAEEDDDEA